MLGAHSGGGGMEEDASSPGWTRRAACRWVTYALIWSLAVATSLVSAYHQMLRVVAGLLGCLLAVSLPVLFATLFEITYSRRARSDLPIICFPWLGSLTVVLGVLALLQASSFLVALLSSTNVDSVHALSSRFAGEGRRRLPRTVCITHAFVKTDWEAGKLRCEDIDGNVACAPAFVAAPVFDDKGLADAGLSEQIYAWAVTRGRHVDANYRPGGRLCGYLAGRMELDYHISDYRLAVTRVMQKHRLSLGQFVGNEGKPIPLEARPLLLTVDPLEVTHVEQALLAVSFVLLCCCPCAGPLPIAALLAFACWSRRGRYGSHHAVSPEDYDEGDVEADEGPRFQRGAAAWRVFAG